MTVITGSSATITISDAAVGGGGGGGGLLFGGGTGLFFGIYSSPNGGMIADFSGRAQGVTFTTNEHGFADLSAFVPLTLEDSFFLYDRTGTPHVVISDRGAIVWEGRLEDVAIVDGGVRLKAFGYQRALSDVPYTAVWSVSRYDDFKPSTIDFDSNALPERYAIDNNNRLFIAPQKNASLGSTTTLKHGGLHWITTDNAGREVISCSFNYAFNAASPWSAYLSTYQYPTLTFVQNNWSLSGSAGSQAGSAAVTFSSSPADVVQFRMAYGAADAAYTGETGAYYLKITGLRIQTTTSSSVYADEIAKHIVSTVSGVNSGQLSTSTVLINSPAVDLSNESYFDANAADILTRLAGLGDTSGSVWEWGVYDGQMLHFRQRGSAGRAWYVDAAALEVERTIDTLANSVYAIYQDGDGRTRRSSTSADTPSATKYGLTRRRAVSTDATNSTQAGYIRDTALNDGKDPSPRIGITFRELYDAAGGRWPLWYARSGDTITVRNLPPTISTAIDRIRTFRLSETNYSADDDALTVTPETPLPALDVLVARRAAGL